jgi:uncharacterized surface protein with fasciclin (FAS1) repeats
MPRITRFLRIPLFTAALLVALGAATPSSRAADILDTAAAAGGFNSLLAVVAATKMERPLRGPGPFTIFAPNDPAFGKLPAWLISYLFQPQNVEALTAILEYHAVPGKIMAADLKGKKTTLKTLHGDPLVIDGTGGALKANAGTPYEGAVIATDIVTDNGVVHVVDTVLTPLPR